MKTLIIVKADTNDADYVHKITDWDNHLKQWKKWVKQDCPHNLETFRKIGQVIKESKQGHNWNTSDYINKDEKVPEELYRDVLNKDEIAWFDENFIPSGEHGIHTIKSIIILEVGSEENLL